MKVILSLIVIIFGSCSCSSTRSSTQYQNIYQYYTPVTDSASRAFLTAGIAKVRSQFGAPRVPVKEVFLRYSVRNRQPWLLSQADILSWPVFLRQLKSSEIFSKGPVEIQSLINSRVLLVGQKLSLLQYVNQLISEDDLLRFDGFRELKQQSFLLSSRVVINRHLLSQKFEASF
ncbi:MAG: hypothetical protein HRT88_09245 [Lentisphaeraceae bacterium]|nr:hypothetical protein [Lentisphaeraceae bacterium]